MKSNNKIAFLLPVLIAAAVIAVVFVSAPDAAWAHGGHGKAEVQYKVVPSKLEDPDAVMIKMGELSATRGEFFDYIRNIAAFQMKADLLQRRFLLHFWVIEGVARYYPSDINLLMQRLVDMDEDWAERPKLINEWAQKQAGLYIRLLLYHEKAKAWGADKQIETRWILECFSQHIKADFMEEMVLLGSMEPTFKGVRDFVAGLSSQERKRIETLYKDPDKISSMERQGRRKRWIQYRRDMMKNTKYKRLFEKVDSIDVPAETVIAEVNDHKVTMAQFLAIYGPLQNDVHWNGIKKTRCSKLMLAYAAADEVDRLGILPERYRDKIAFSNVLYLAADQIAREFGHEAILRQQDKIDFQFFREVCRYLNLMRLEKIYVEETEKLPEYKDLWIDTPYLESIQWIIAPAFTPEQATYF